MLRAFRVALAMALLLAGLSLSQARAGTQDACDFVPDYLVCIDNFCAANGGHCIVNGDNDGCLCQLNAQQFRSGR